jgi:basic membrane protein A
MSSTFRPPTLGGPRCRGAAAILAVALSLLAAGCSPNARRPEDAGKVHVGIVFDIGGKDDRSFNAAAWEGVRRAAEDYPIVLRDVEPGDPTSIEPAMRAFAERGYDLMIGVGFAQAAVIEQVAKDYPKLQFVAIDAVIDLPNVASLVFKEHEGSYLVGMIAGRKSASGVVGFVGGMDIPLIHRFAKGYEEGVLAVNPAARVLVNYVGVNDAAWNNPGKGKELAVAQIERGADVLFTAAGNSGLGAFDAAEQYDKFVIGVDSNQNWVKPGHVLTSMVKRIDNVVYQFIGERVAGRFEGGIHVYGLANDGVGYAVDDYNRALIPAAVIAEVEAARQKIIAGEIKVTDAMSQ